MRTSVLSPRCYRRSDVVIDNGPGPADFSTQIGEPRITIQYHTYRSAESVEFHYLDHWRPLANSSTEVKQDKTKRPFLPLKFLPLFAKFNVLLFYDDQLVRT